ncbi:MAG TPA: hypothetical protein VFR94_24280 [Nitrososphaeraceae archaeon]|nr:hypothetical protein [Nitrososphaeraceae archaeon]
MAPNDTFFPSSMRRKGDKSSKMQREMRKTEIYRLQAQGLTDEEILASLNRVEEGQEHPHFPISRRQYYRDLQSLRNDIIKRQLAERDELFLVDLDETVEGLKEARRLNGDIMRNPSIDPSTRLKAIELDAFLLTTILKIKYEGKAFIKGLGTLVEKSKRLQQKQKEKASENEIRSTVTTGIYPNDFITFPTSASTSSDSGVDPQAKY